MRWYKWFLVPLVIAGLLYVWVISGLIWLRNFMRKHLLWWVITLDVAAVAFVLWGLGVFSHLHWSKWYHWFWHDVCGLPQPFTMYMRESALAHPYWWILTPIVLGIGFFLWVWLGDPDWWSNKPEREKHFVWYLGGIILYSVYYVLVCHLWGIL